MTEATVENALWYEMDGWERWSDQYSHLGIEELSEYLRSVSGDVSEFVRRGVPRTIVDTTVGEEWNERVESMSEAERVTVLFELAVEADSSSHFRVKTKGASDMGAHGPWAVVVKHLEGSTLTDVINWVDSVSSDNTAIARTEEAIARHGPYAVRVGQCERARSAYPYVAELVTSMDSQPDPDWWDTDALWFGEEASFETFRDHLINHWTDSARSQGGVIARELAAQYSENPVWGAGGEPYYGFGALSVPFESPPPHLVEKFERLRSETEDHYRDAGIESVTLYRGVRETVESPAPLESWTDSLDEAERYTGTDGCVMERDVPVDLIVFSHETIPADRWSALAGYKGGPPGDELGEFAVLGGTGL